MAKDEKNSTLKLYKEGHLGLMSIQNDVWGKKKNKVQFASIIILDIPPQTALIVHTLKHPASFNINCRRTYSN